MVNKPGFFCVQHLLNIPTDGKRVKRGNSGYSGLVISDGQNIYQGPMVLW